VLPVDAQITGALRQIPTDVGTVVRRAAREMPDMTAQAMADAKARGVKFHDDEITATPGCHMAFGEDPEGNQFILHHRKEQHRGRARRGARRVPPDLQGQLTTRREAILDLSLIHI